MNYQTKTLKELLSDREIFSIFDQEFNKDAWLDITGLLASESRISDLHDDGSVPADVLDRIERRLREL